METFLTLNTNALGSIAQFVQGNLANLLVSLGCTPPYEKLSEYS